MIAGRVEHSSATAYLCDLFAELLDVREIGADDGFFESGGDSLRALALAWRVRRDRGVHLNLGQVFEAPTPRMLGELMDGAARLTGGSGEAGGAAGAGGAGGYDVPAAATAPLSADQREEWTRQQRDPCGTGSNLSTLVRLHGVLDIPALKLALTRVTQRHEAFRVCLVGGGEMLRQATAAHDQSEVRLDVQDLTGVEAGDRDRALAAQVHEASSRGFDVEHPPLARAVLYALEKKDHALLLVMHRAVCDDWSLEILLREIERAYGGETAPGAATGCVAYAAWRAAHAQASKESSDLAWWRQRWAMPPPPLELPSDRPKSSTSAGTRGRVEFRVGEEIADALRAVGRAEDATPCVALLSAYAVLLRRLSGARDMVIGVPAACREEPIAEKVVGRLAGMKPVRVEVEGDPTFRALLGRVRLAVGETLRHAAPGFDSIIEAMHAAGPDGRGLSLTAAFRHSGVRRGIDLPGIDARVTLIDHGDSRFDVVCSLTEERDGIAGVFEYAADLFDAATIERFVQRFQTLLRSIASSPELPVGRLEILSEAERRLVVEEFNATRVEYPRDSTIHGVFEEQAARTPDAIAVVGEGSRLTYAELNAWANRVAHELRTHGVGRGDRVALGVARDAAYAAAVLGVLKAGAAYVPLDGGYPTERLRFMLEDSGARALIRGGARGNIPHLSGVAEIVVFSDGRGIDGSPPENPVVGGTAQDAAYLIYTSGSTGRPKGTIIPHRGVVRLVCGQGYAPFGPEQVHALTSTTTFDASTFELWGALLNGGRLVACPAGMTDPRTLRTLIEGHGVTVLWLTAALYNTVIDEAPESLAGLKALLIGGEALSVPHVVRGLRALPGTAIINGYGPTESTTFTTTHRIPRDLPLGATSVPIGRPIANTAVYVLDEYLRPAPIGVAGELCIGGDGLAIEYLNQAGLTREKFVEVDFLPAGASRVYRSGDRACFLPDGTIRFLGRGDNQVKIRGFRIEPDEIAAVIVGMEGVSRAAVVAQRDPRGDLQLVAYVVGEAGAPLDAARLGERLAEGLPHYMRPSHVMVLPDLPLGPTGKIDRARLPSPTALQRGDAPAKKCGGTSDRVCGLLAGVLGVKRVQPSDRFLDLGGHSLTAMVATWRVRRDLGAIVSIDEVLSGRTIAEFVQLVERRTTAAALTNGAPNRAPSEVRTLSKEPDVQERIALLPCQAGLWFLHQLDSESSAYNVPLLVRFRGPLDVDALKRAVACVAARHDAFRIRLAAEDGEPYQTVVSASEAPLNVAEADLSQIETDGRERALRDYAARAAVAPFDLGKAPLARVSIIRLGEEDHALLVVVHHVVCDEWSMDMLVRELGSIYTGAGEPGPASSYAGYAMSAAPDAARIERDLAWWRARWRRPPAALMLPADRARHAATSDAAGRVEFGIGPGEAEALLAMGRREGLTPFATFLTVFYVLIRRLSGQGDIVIGTPMSSRDDPVTESIFGYLVNMVPVRVTVDEEPTFRELMGEMRRAAAETFAHGSVPLHTLVQELHPDRTDGQSPMFSIVFQYADNGGYASCFPGVRTRVELLGSTTARFDLHCSVSRGPDGVCGFFEFASGMFEAETVRRMSDCFRALVRSIVDAPDASVESLPMLDGSGPLPDGQARHPSAGAGRAAGVVDAAVSHAAPSAGEPALLEIWRRVLNIDEVSPTTSFFDLGGHSLLAIRLFAVIEREFGVQLPVSTIFRLPTVRQLAHELDRGVRMRDDACLVPLRVTGAGPPVFLLSGIGGQVISLKPLIDRFATHRICIGLEPPGMDGVVTPLGSVPAIAEALVKRIRVEQPSGPYWLAGYSFGGVVAFEIGRQLREAGEEVASLLLIDSYPTGSYFQKSRAERLAIHFNRFVRSPWSEMWSHAGRMNKRARPRIGRVLEEPTMPAMTVGGGAAKEVGRMCRVAYDRYIPQAADLFAHVFVRAETPDWQEFLTGPGERSWVKYLQAGASYHVVNGDHLSLVKDGHVEDLARAMNRCLAWDELGVRGRVNG